MSNTNNNSKVPQVTNPYAKDSNKKVSITNPYAKDNNSNKKVAISNPYGKVSIQKATPDGITPVDLMVAKGSMDDPTKEDCDEEIAPTKLSFEPMEGSILPKKLPGRTDGSHNNPVLGVAKNTSDVRQKALKLLNIWLHEIEGLPPFQDLLFCHIEGDNLINLCWKFGATIVSIPIPQNATKGFMPGPTGSKKQLMWTSIKQYMGAVKNCLQEKFPDHPTWPRSPSDNPDWFKELIQAMEVEYKRNYLKIWSKSPELEYGNYKTRPIYSRAPYWDNEDEFESIQKWNVPFHGDDGEGSRGKGPTGSFGALASTNNNLLGMMTRRFAQECDPHFAFTYEAAARDIITWQMIARGGEVKFCRWSETVWIPQLQALGIVKHQQKTLSQGQMVVMLHHRKEFLLCPHFWLGCFMFLGEGLYRTALQMNEGSGDSIFPREFNRSTSAVSRRIGDCLKRSLDPCTPPEEKDCISQRSLRQGAITEISCHPRAGPMEVCGRSGHSTGLNIDVYMDYMNPQRSLVGGQILSGHTNFSCPVRVPCPWHLESHFKDAFLQLLHDILSNITVKGFGPGEHLHEFLQLMIANQLMYYGTIKARFPDSPWLRFWEEKCKHIKDPHNPEWSVSDILEEWSRVLDDSYTTLNDRVQDVMLTQHGVYRLHERVEESIARSTRLDWCQKKCKEEIDLTLNKLNNSFVELRKELVTTRGMYA